MWVGGRRLLSWLAIYAIALHSILLGVAPLFAAPTVDPFSVICHSEAPGATPAEQTPASPASAPAKSCDHCTLCSAMAPPDPLDGVVIAQLSPPKLLAVLRPAIAAPRDGIAYNPNRARGPPSFA
jgi:hypothetical protein